MSGWAAVVGCTKKNVGERKKRVLSLYVLICQLGSHIEILFPKKDFAVQVT